MPRLARRRCSSTKPRRSGGAWSRKASSTSSSRATRRASWPITSIGSFSSPAAARAKAASSPSPPRKSTSRALRLSAASTSSPWKSVSLTSARPSSISSSVKSWERRSQSSGGRRRPSEPSSADSAIAPHRSTIRPMSELPVLGQLHRERLRRREAQAPRLDGRPDVGDEVPHALPGVALLDPLLDRELVAGGAGPAERQEADAQPLLEQRLLDLLVAARLAKLHHDLLAQLLVAGLFVDDLLDDAAVGHERAVLVFLELPEAAAVVQELRHRQLEPALRERHRLAGQPLLDPRLDRLAGEIAVHLGHGLVVLGLFLDVPDHEAQPFVGDEAQAVAEQVRRGQLAIGLALHELHDHPPVVRRHVLGPLEVFHFRSLKICFAITSFWISLVPS